MPRHHHWRRIWNTFRSFIPSQKNPFHPHSKTLRARMQRRRFKKNGYSRYLRSRSRFRFDYRKLAHLAYELPKNRGQCHSTHFRLLVWHLSPKTKPPWNESRRSYLLKFLEAEKIGVLVVIVPLSVTIFGVEHRHQRIFTAIGAREPQHSFLPSILFWTILR